MGYEFARGFASEPYSSVCSHAWRCHSSRLENCLRGYLFLPLGSGLEEQYDTVRYFSIRMSEAVGGTHPSWVAGKQKDPFNEALWLSLVEVVCTKRKPDSQTGKEERLSLLVCGDYDTILVLQSREIKSCS